MSVTIAALFLFILSLFKIKNFHQLKSLIIHYHKNHSERKKKIKSSSISVTNIIKNVINFFNKFDNVKLKFHFVKDYKINYLFSRPYYRSA